MKFLTIILLYDRRREKGKKQYFYYSVIKKIMEFDSEIWAIKRRKERKRLASVMYIWRRVNINYKMGRILNEFNSGTHGNTT